MWSFVKSLKKSVIFKKYMCCVQQSCEKTVVLICMYVFLNTYFELGKTYLLTKIVIVIVRCTKEMLIVIPKLFLRVTWCLFKFTYWFIKKMERLMRAITSKSHVHLKQKISIYFANWNVSYYVSLFKKKKYFWREKYIRSSMINFS